MNRPTNGKLECKKHMEGLTQVDTVIWTVSNFAELIMANKGKLLISCSNIEVGGKEHLKYNLKIECNPWDQYRKIKVYFQSHQKVMVPTVTIKEYNVPPSPFRHNQLHRTLHPYLNISEHNQQKSGDPSKAVPIKGYMVADPHKWHFLISEYNISSIKHGLMLTFQFRTYNVHIMNKIQGVFSWVDFGNLLGNELFSDVVIKSTGGKEYKAHKVILAFRSSVLKTNIETKLNATRDCKPVVVEAPYSSEVVQEVLKFIYTNQGDLNLMTDIYELLDAAEYYHIGGLKELCQATLCEKLTLINAVHSLELALKYGLKNLEIAVLQFSKDNWDSLIKTEAWINLRSVEVAKRFTECHSLDSL